MPNSSTTAEADLIEPIHPGEVLMEDCIEGFGITQHKLAVSIGAPRVESTRSSTASEASWLTRPFVWRATSARLTSCG